MGYSPWGRKELDTTEQLHFLSFFFNRLTTLWMIIFPDNVFHFYLISLKENALFYNKR